MVSEHKYFIYMKFYKIRYSWMNEWMNECLVLKMNLIKEIKPFRILLIKAKINGHLNNNILNNIARKFITFKVLIL